MIFEITSFCAVDANSRLEAWQKFESYLKENSKKFAEDYSSSSLALAWDKKTKKTRAHQLLKN